MERVHLANQLEVGLPASLDLTYQPLEGELNGESVICAWLDDDLQYIVGADDQPGGLDHEDYWEGLDETLQSHPDLSKLKLVRSGDYVTYEGTPVSYRIYRMHEEEGEQFHVYHLLNNDEIAYWVIATLRSLADIFVVNAGVTEILRTARLTPAAIE